MAADTTTEAAELEAFLGKALGDIAGLTTSVLAGIGDRVGLFRALHATGPSSPAELAAAAGTDERYTREWLAAMTGAGYVNYDPSAGLFSLPPERAAVLAEEEGPVFLGGVIEMLLGALPVIDRVADCFRHGGGVPQAAYPPRWWEGMERFSATYFGNLLVPQWLPAVPEVRAALSQGCDVADIGCGAGKGVITMATAFPASRYVGYDQYAPNIEHARRRAHEAGVTDRVRFEVLDAARGVPQTYDVIFTFDVVHDAADPLGLLRAIRGALRPGGRYVCLDINCSPRLEDNGGPLGAFFYGVSTLYCMTTSLAAGGAGLGTAGLPHSVLEQLAREAGFSAVRQAEIDNPFNNLYELIP